MEMLVIENVFIVKDKCWFVYVCEDICKVDLFEFILFG